MGNDPPSDPSDPGGSDHSSDHGSHNSRKSNTSRSKKKKNKAKKTPSRPPLRNLPDPGAASAEVLTATRSTKEEILREYRNPLAREAYAKRLDPLSLDELKLALESVKRQFLCGAGKIEGF